MIFRNWVLENFPFLEDDFDALTDYELFCKMVEYMRKSLEHIKTYDSKFVEFNDRLTALEHYFDNLDLQDEVNNKLDEMAESGELADIIAQYLGLAGVLAYDTVSDMVQAENIGNGSICLCLGYETYDDEKGSYYKIRPITSGDVVDGINIIALDSSDVLVAEKLNNFASYSDLSNYLPLSYGDGDHLGVGNKTYTSKSAWTGTVASVRANRQETQPDILKSAPTNFAPHTSSDASLYRSRDSVALFVGNQSKNADFKQDDAAGIIYGENYVTYFNDEDVDYFKVGAVIDTNHDNPLSAIIQSVDTENKRIYVEDGWYYNGVKNSSPAGNKGYQIGKVTKIWGINQTVMLNNNFDTRNAVGQEIGLINSLPSGTPKQMVGIDVVTQSTGKADIGYLARTGDAQFDSPDSIGKIDNGFVAKDCGVAFASHDDRDDEFLLVSRTSDGTLTNNRFYIRNDGTMSNPHLQKSSNIAADGQYGEASARVWIFVPNQNIEYTLPDVTNELYSKFNYRIYTFCNRSNYTITLSNGYVIQPFASVTYYTYNVWLRIAAS